jgi:hypothetical protein
MAASSALKTALKSTPCNVSTIEDHPMLRGIAGTAPSRSTDIAGLKK